MKILLLYQPSPEHLNRLRSAAPSATFVIARDEQTAKTEIELAEAVFGNRYFLQSLPHAGKLRWMQSNSMGVDIILEGAGERLAGVTLTCARGVYADELADHAMALLLGVSRGLRDAVESFQQRDWGRWTLPTLAGRKCLILGWGSIGRAVGQRLAAFGVEVHAVRSREDAAADPPAVSVHGPQTWRNQLAGTDILMIALPLTAETRGMVGAAELASLPRGAIVINVGRGPVIDEPALFHLLREGHLFGAGLDTLTEEPPGPEAAVWSVPRLLLTPHVGRSLEIGAPRWESLFEENLRRYVRGEELLNVVDHARGY